MLAIRHLTKQFYQKNGAVTVVDDLSLEVKKGQVFGLIGPNGAGKTTTVKLVAGLLFPDKGQITIGGNPAGSSRSPSFARVKLWGRQRPERRWHAREPSTR